MKKIYNKKNKVKKTFSIVKLLILLGIIIGIPTIIYFLFPEYIQQFKTLDGVNAFLAKYKTASIYVYIGLQILQLIVSVIPGQILQFAAGYAYTFWFGFLYSFIGIIIGTTLTFYLSRLLGKDAMHVIFGEEKINRFVNLLNSKKAYIILFVLFVIPGFPKDLVTYAAGVSEIKIKPFLILSLVGRTPALMTTIMMGSMFHNGSYLGLIILGILAVIAFILGILNRHKLINYTDVAYEKLIKSK
ncbi:TVP38/TMEM64 family protein [Anaerovorax odorimutans]|uniref:TVP38/TMEM64 family protein n=1 Tax=Anaerovorax odorimutans TaxID=109327 RepID=UPI0004222AE1|nr:VTT domain-containing protein [Anaerovorax odorimutans]